MSWRPRPTADPDARSARFDGLAVAVLRPIAGRLGRPTDRIRDHPADHRLVVRGMRFVTGPEVEDPAAAA